MPLLADWVEHDFTIVACRDCPHHYLDPAPTEESLELYYGADYFAADHTAPANQRPELSAADRFFFATCRWPPVRRGRLLDVGCGNGKYLLWARRLGLEVEGFDRARYPLASGAEEIPVHLGELTSSDLPAATFDVVTMWWMLENTPRPLDHLRAARRLLKPGGYLLVGVCNYGCPEARLFGGYWHHLVLPEHLSFFTPRSLVELVRRAGFERLRLRHHPLSFDSSMSLAALAEHRLGLRLPLAHPALRLALVPAGVLKAWLRLSGNIGLLARRPVAEAA